MNFTQDAYRKILICAKAEGYKFVNYLSFNSDSKDKQLILRHDVDFSPSIAFEMAIIDSELRIQSSFAIMLASPLYNVFTYNNLNIIKEIYSLGHNIILHTQSFAGEGLYTRRRIYREWKLMCTIFPFAQPIFVWHQPEGENLKLVVPPLINAYYFRDFDYVSDSMMERSPDQIIETIQGDNSLLVVSLHPVIWMSEQADMNSAIIYALNKAFEEQEKQELIKLRSWRKLCPT